MSRPINPAQQQSFPLFAHVGDRGGVTWEQVGDVCLHTERVTFLPEKVHFQPIWAELRAPKSSAPRVLTTIEVSFAVCPPGGRSTVLLSGPVSVNALRGVSRVLAEAGRQGDEGPK